MYLGLLTQLMVNSHCVMNRVKSLKKHEKLFTLVQTVWMIGGTLHSYLHK